MGLNYNTVNGWCNNHNQPYLSDLVKVAELREVAPADLIVDGTKKGKDPTESRTFLENFAYNFENDCRNDA